MTRFQRQLVQLARNTLHSEKSNVELYIWRTGGFSIHLLVNVLTAAHLFIDI